MSFRGTATDPAALGKPDLHRPAPKLRPVNVGLIADELAEGRGGHIVERPDGEQEDDQVAGVPSARLDHRRQNGDGDPATPTEESSDEDRNIAQLIAEPGFPAKTAYPNTVADDDDRFAHRQRYDAAAGATRRTDVVDIWPTVQRILDPERRMNEDQSARDTKTEHDGKEPPKLAFPSLFSWSSNHSTSARHVKLRATSNSLTGRIFG
jgi:hypothetical protein